MKKTLALIISLILTLSLLCAGALALEAADIVGTWKLTTLEMMGVSLHPADLGMDIEMVFVFNEDYTVIAQGFGEDLDAEAESESIAWAIKDGLVIMNSAGEDAGEEVSLVFEDGTLVLEMEEEGMAIKMILSKVNEA